MNITDINVSAIGDSLNKAATKKDLLEVKEYLQQLTDELKYELTHVDETNMTQELVDVIQAGSDTSALGTSSSQRFMAGLKLTGSLSSDRISISLSSNNISLGSVSMSMGALKSSIIDMAYPIGSLFSTYDTEITTPADALGIGTWEDITPEGQEYRTFKRVAETESEAEE